MSRPWGQRRAFASRRGRQGRTVLPRLRLAWTGPNDGAVGVAKTHGVRGDGRRDALASGQSSADELAGVALVDLGAGGADGLAAVPHAVISMPPGSPAVSQTGASSPVARSMAS